MSLPDYLQILRRRKWLLLFVVVVLPAGVVAYSLTQPARYSASAEVLLSHQDITAALSGTPEASSSTVDAARDAETQAGLARVPGVVRASIAHSGERTSVRDFLNESSVSSSPNSDLLTFQVEAGTARGAVALVNAYARAFSRYRKGLDTASLRRARHEVTNRLSGLAAAGDQSSPLYQHLANKLEELRVSLALQTSHAVVVRTADNATQVQPKPVRNGIVAFVLASILGVGLAFGRDALDTRLRSASDIADRLQLPLLARLPRPPRRLAKKNKIVMLAEPQSPGGESFRVLRTNFDLVNASRNCRSILVASAVQEEGKSTTAANLAVASALAGRQVILLDLDLRRGNIESLFSIEGKPGLTDLALSDGPLTNVLVSIDIGSRNGLPDGGSALTGVSRGWLKVLPAGPFPADPGDFVVSETVAGLLDRLRGSADLLIVDVPPLLQSGDGLALASRVDGIVALARRDIKESTLAEFVETLDRLTTQKLGVIVTGDDSDQRRYAGYYRAAPSSRKAEKGSKDEADSSTD